MHIVRNCTPKDIESAARTLIEGKLIAFPTETVYGLGADAENSEAVKKIYEIKGRPSNHPLIVHISSLDLMEYWAINIPDYAWKLAKKFWPGPLTLILKRSNNAKNFITGNQETIGIRIPNNPIALNLLKEFEKLGGHGIAAPSANRFGAVSPTTSDDVQIELSKFDRYHTKILDGGSCDIGLESTILGCLGKKPKILRPGYITLENFSLDRFIFKVKDNHNLRVSGVFEKHYAPKTEFEEFINPVCGAGFLALKEYQTPKEMVRLASPVDVVDFAKNLYSALRLADNLRLKKAFYILPEATGLGIAIIDRLRKASSKTEYKWVEKNFNNS